MLLRIFPRRVKSFNTCPAVPPISGNGLLFLINPKTLLNNPLLAQISTCLHFEFSCRSGYFPVERIQDNTRAHNLPNSSAICNRKKMGSQSACHKIYDGDAQAREKRSSWTITYPEHRFRRRIHTVGAIGVGICANQSKSAFKENGNTLRSTYMLLRFIKM